MKWMTANLYCFSRSCTSSGKTGSETHFEVVSRAQYALPCQMLLDFAEIPPRDRVADEQHPRQVVLVGVGDPDVGPFDPFSDRLLGGYELGDGKDGDQCGEEFVSSVCSSEIVCRQWAVLFEVCDHLSCLVESSQPSLGQSRSTVIARSTASRYSVPSAAVGVR